MNKIRILLYIILTVILSSFASAWDPVNLAYFRFEEDRTNTDGLMGSDWEYDDGTFDSYQTGIVGSHSMKFLSDSSSPYVSDGISTTLNASVVEIRTIDFWINYTGAAGGEDIYFMDFGSSESTDNDNLVCNLKNDIILFKLLPNNVEKWTVSHGPMNNNQWQHIVLVMGSGGVKLYVNGTLVDSDASTDVMANDMIYTALGTLTRRDRESLVGEIDNVFFSSDEYDQPDVTAAYNSGAGVDYSGAPPPGALTMEIVYPEDDEGFGIADLTDFDNTLWINGTHDNDTSTVCTINDSTLFGTDQGGNLAMDFNWTFTNQTELADGTYHFKVGCNRTGTLNDTDTVRFIIDTSNPTITPSTLLLNNKMLIWNMTNQTLVFDMNFTDNLEIYSVNITLENGTVIYNATNIGLTHYEVNASFLLGGEINNWIDVRVCDAHTATSISDIENMVEKQGIKYIIENRFMWQEDDWVHIYPKDFLFYNTPTTMRSKDRYAFTFNKITTPSITETFVVESSHYIDISRLQSVGGHLIIPKIGKNGYWIDFVNSDATHYTIKRINDKKIEITITGLKGKAMLFSSIGELNCVTERYYFGQLRPIQTYTSVVLVNETSTFTLEVHHNSQTMGNINATLWYNKTAYYNTTSDYPTLGIGNFSVDVTAPSEIYGNITNIGFYWTVNISGYYNMTHSTQAVSNFFLDNCTSSYYINSINFTILNITDNNKLSGDMEFYFDYFYLGLHRNFSVSINNKNNQSFCIFPNQSTFYIDMHVDYSAGDSNTFNYILNNTAISNVSRNINLYITDDTDLVTFTVRDITGSTIQDVIIKVLEWDIGSGTFKLANILESDYNGQAFGYLNLYDTWYKFILIYQGSVVLDTSPTKITATSVTFTINLEEEYYEAGVTPEGIWAAISFDNTSKYFTFTWDELDNTVSEACLEIYKHTLNGKFLVNSSCTAAGTGSIVRGIGENTSTNTFVAKGFATISGNRMMVAIKSISFEYGWKQFGNEGVWVSFLMITTITMVGLWNISVAIILMMVGFIAMSVIGFFHMEWTWLATFIILGIIAIVRINRR